MSTDHNGVSASPRASGLPGFLALLLVLAAGFAVFRDAGRYDFVQFDDPALVTANPYVNRGLTTDSVIWAFTLREQEGHYVEPMAKELWAPLSFLSHALDVELWGLNPSRHHWMNLALHLLNTALVFSLFSLLSKRTFVAAVVAAIFCFHPMRIESVAWVSERKDVLSGLFLFGCLNLYCLWARRGPGTGRRLLFLGAVAAYLAACLAKPMTVAAVGLLVLMDVWPLRRVKTKTGRAGIGSFLANQAKEKWAFLVILAAISVVTVWLKHEQVDSPRMGGVDLATRLTELPATLLFYLERTLWPKGLFPEYVRYPHPFLPYSIVAIAVLTAITIAAWKWRKRFPELLFGWVWFLICLGPVLGFFYVSSSFTSDRYTYVAHCGLAFAVARLISREMERDRSMCVPLTILTTCILAGAGIWSNRQAGIWANSEALFSYGVRVQPRSMATWNNLGAHLVNAGRTAEGLACLRRATEIGDDPGAYYNIGCALHRMGTGPKERAEAFRRCIELDPAHTAALMELGMILTNKASGETRDPEEGARLLEQACDLLEHRRSSRVSTMKNRLLEIYDELGDEAGSARVRAWKAQ